jgi:predicted TIM-barrel fold metal-dependent hydrolase
LDHAGFPIERNSSYFSNWKNGMASISRLENVICKISGLGMGDNRWTVESIRPYVETCIELFGCEKALFASNWPIDSLWSSYDTLISAYRSITQNYSVEEKELLFSRNTESIYGI